MAQVTLTEQQSGTRITVRVGDVIETRLLDNAGPGYSWNISSMDSTRLSLVSQKKEGARAAAGSAGTSVIRLNVEKPGTTRLEMISARPFPSNHPVASRFSVDVDITE